VTGGSELPTDFEGGQAEISQLREILEEVRAQLTAPRPMGTSPEEHVGDRLHNALAVLDRAGRSGS